MTRSVALLTVLAMGTFVTGTELVFVLLAPKMALFDSLYLHFS